MLIVGCYFDKHIKCNRFRITTSSSQMTLQCASLLFIGNTDIIEARLNSVIDLFFVLEFEE